MNSLPNQPIQSNQQASSLGRAFTEPSALPMVRIDQLQNQAGTMPLNEIRPSEILIDLYPNAPQNLYPAQPSAMDHGLSPNLRSNIGPGGAGSRSGVPQQVLVPVVARNQLQVEARRDVVERSPCDDFKEGCKEFCLDRETDRDCVKYARCGAAYTLGTVGTCGVLCLLALCCMCCASGSGSGFLSGGCDCPGPDRFGKSFCPC